MTADQIVVGAVALLGLLGIAGFLHVARGDETQAVIGASGRQEATIVVKGGYTPDTIVAEAGVPIRLTFVREEASACSERVVFDDFARSAELPTGDPVTIDLPAAGPGEYGFRCGMAMLRGTLVVR